MKKYLALLLPICIEANNLNEIEGLACYEDFNVNEIFEDYAFVIRNLSTMDSTAQLTGWKGRWKSYCGSIDRNW